MEEVKEQRKVKRSPKKNFTFAVGRRKTATARVRLYRGAGDNLVNNQPASAYFPGMVAAKMYEKPLELSQTTGKYYFSAYVEGSGKKGQLTAVVHGVARALARVDTVNYRSILKKAGLLTRDSRMKESRTVGTGGKARRQKQSPKR
ncbi:30S ribosomal protein S9 [Microgenomates group bacterium RIFCSPHIGHO2_01_FULL_45_11]|nr:MAG: 30S ribosomal protein S9 [Microgenomates group bacterium RIFCSPHIGHO2_01_FULL_45_11]